MKRIAWAVIIAVVAGAALTVGAAFAAEDAAGKPQKRCPLMGEPIDKNLQGDYEGKRVYFCCAKCQKKFKKDPAKYVKKLEEQGIALEDAPKPQTQCPMSGKPINKKMYADYRGKRVYFCGPGCRTKFQADPAKYVKKLEEQGITLARTPKPQTRCPIKGTPVNKKVYADYKGKRVYFCCADCLPKFKKDPAKYIKKLESQGITLAQASRPQTNCPISGGKINKKQFVDYKGKRVYFCCPGCDKKFLQDPAKYTKKMKAEGVLLEDAPAAKKSSAQP